jgi:hypothetical protein
MDPRSCSWNEPGAVALKKLGLASFCDPANTNVTPRKARRRSKAPPGATSARASQKRFAGSQLPERGRAFTLPSASNAGVVPPTSLRSRPYGHVKSRPAMPVGEPLTVGIYRVLEVPSWTSNAGTVEAHILHRFSARPGSLTRPPERSGRVGCPRTAISVMAAPHNTVSDNGIRRKLKSLSPAAANQPAATRHGRRRRRREQLAGRAGRQSELVERVRHLQVG